MSQGNGNSNNTTEPSDTTKKPTEEVPNSTVVLSAEQKTLLFKEFREQQKLLLEEHEKSKGQCSSKDDQTPRQENGKKRKRNDDEISFVGSHASTDFLLEVGDQGGKENFDSRSEIMPWLNNQHEDPYNPDEENATGDLFDGPDGPTDVNTSPGGVAVSDKQMEGILRSRYTAIMEHTKEKLGDPVVPNIEKMIAASWGKIKLAAKTKTEIHDKIPIPSNCTQLKPPRLNTEVYIRLYENSAVKDKALQDKQRDIAKSTIPILKAMDGGPGENGVGYGEDAKGEETRRNHQRGGPTIQDLKRKSQAVNNVSTHAELQLH